MLLAQAVPTPPCSLNFSTLVLRGIKYSRVSRSTAIDVLSLYWSDDDERTLLSLSYYVHYLCIIQYAYNIHFAIPEPTEAALN